MTPFQLVVAPLLGLLAGWNAFRAFASTRRRKSAVVGAMVWLAACACVLWPSLLTMVARLLGIGRGADLVFYVFCLIFLIFSFYGYNRLLQLDAALTGIVRHLALLEVASRPSDENQHEVPKQQPLDQTLPKD